jgi:KDO2-lipid IV(A) lauroyltransferase
LRVLLFEIGGYRRAIINDNLERCFPNLTPAARRRLARQFQRQFVDVIMEIVKGTSLSASAINERVRIVNPEILTAALSHGSPAIVVGAHQCNWEWMLFALSFATQCPIEAAYKPLHDRWAEELMTKTRSRFGATMFPAKTLLSAALSKGRNTARVIALNADQEPVTADRRHWIPFLGRDTAFFMGLGEITKASRFPVFFCGMRRTSRGRYEMRLQQLAAAAEPGLDARTVIERYAAAVEAQILASPADWLWTNRRWKLKKPLYGP